MIALTDTHCHLNLHHFQDDLDLVIQRANQSGINKIIIPGTDLETSRKAIEIADRFQGCFAAVGVHPNDATQWNSSTLNTLIELAQNPKVVAIGEIGLDYYRDYSPKELQKEILIQQLSTAETLNLPVILHNRSSFFDLWPILEAWVDRLHANNQPYLKNYPGVLHSFDGDVETAKMLTKKNFLIGISGPVTFQNGVDRQTVVRQIPPENLLIETDAPYLTPHPHRGKRNEPAYVRLVAEKISALLNLDINELSHILNTNVDQLFLRSALS